MTIFWTLRGKKLTEKKETGKKRNKKWNWQLCFNFFQSCEEWFGRFVVTREKYSLNAFQNSLTTDSPNPTNNSTVLIFQVDDMNEFGAFSLHTNWKEVLSIAEESSFFYFKFTKQIQNLQLLLTPFSSNFQDMFQDNCFGERRHIYFIGLHLSILKPATPVCFDFPTTIRP